MRQCKATEVSDLSPDAQARKVRTPFRAASYGDGGLFAKSDAPNRLDAAPKQPPIPPHPVLNLERETTPKCYASWE